MSQVNAHKPRVMLLFGGRSSEHPVSCVTAAGVLEAIDREKYEVVPVGITRDGAWTLVDQDVTSWSLSNSQKPEVTAGSEILRLTGEPGSHELLASNDSHAVRSLGDIDLVFPLLHGPFGEDGSLQGMLEMVDVPYVGSGIAASAIGMDKHFMKVVFEAAGFEVGPYVVIPDKHWERDQAACLKSVEGLQYPLFVKPARAGSSVGISRVDTADALPAAIEAARIHDPKVIVEQGIVGREIECGVLEGRGSLPPRASMPGEIVVEDAGHTFYDFDAKYVDGAAAQLSCPAELETAATDEVRRLAAEAFEAVNAEGLSRVDFFYTPEGKWIINEINTMPGFTPSSMYPHMWSKTGLEYADLIDELIHLGLSRKTGLR
ncbi:D-alanine--D-alanine ligase family protein [Paeniglutamicibacter sulfureus]|uniref:D-alanine--D-alanine ligase n=1 Tax=Paeniglutamicibacter sulfureus TaxID=43666 RepID=A0ABU2BP24_9MICC|nr:D-alanine--D-alanine ligase family protein [Paeniglutamicibacter sulfureus]MDO2936017.1 D-alanine--D-alanine ligase family protein [Paeniglutamicibacter sulfureus]MDR7360399.1 D-alanine-D-alanine ligase [Paeniglutamicibacter sulfureus]